jgi:Flp pilus assembly protein TadG
MSIFRFRRFSTDRAGATAVVFGLSVMAMMLIVAIAIDFAGVVAAKTKLELAADTAAMTAATTASQMYIAGGNTTAQIQTAATTAGQNRFVAAFGGVNNVAAPSLPTVTVNQDPNTNAFTALLTDSATYTPYFARLLGVNAVPLSATSTVSVALTAPFLNVEILLDNSGSMEIAATPSDIETMQELTACGLTGAYYCSASTTSKSGTTTCSSWVQSSGLALTDPYRTAFSSSQSYSAYGCTAGSYTYNGSPACPLVATTLDSVSYPAFPVTGKNPGPSCPSVVPMPRGETAGDTNYNHKGFAPAAGAPCAFACHFDTTSPAGTGNDYYALARSTIGTPYQVNLRFDLVKSAVKQVVSAMQTDNLPINNLKVGIFWFADILTKVYPTDGTEASNDWATVLADVGGPATVANGADTGIQPYVGANGGNTDFPTIMTDLGLTLTASGTGATSTTPRKVLFIVTDGLQDPASRAIGAFDPSSCTAFKNLGYKIYVLYTPYYSLMNPYYLNGTTPSAAAAVQAAPTATNSIPYNLQQCASSASNYLEASDSTSIAAALQTFLKQALVSNAKITQ